MDQVHDKTHAQLWKVSQEYNMPDFVGNAGLLTEKEASKLPGSAFADSVSRLFPIDTKANTWLSCAFFDKIASKNLVTRPNETRSRLTDACALWKIEWPRMEKQASESRDKIAISIQYRHDNKTLDTVRVSSPEHLLKVAEDLTKNAQRFPWETRRDVARQLLHAAPTFNITFSAPMQTLLQKTSGYGIGGLSEAVTAIRQRKAALSQLPECQEKLDELTTVLNKQATTGILDPGLLDKTASLLDAVDRLGDLHLKYSDTFTFPERQLFQTTLSDVDEFQKKAVLLKSGRCLVKEAVYTESVRRFLNDCLGVKCRTVDDISKNFDALSDNQQNLVENFVTGELD